MTEAIAKFIKEQMTITEIAEFLRTINGVGERYLQFLSAKEELHIAYLDALEEVGPEVPR